MKLLREFLQVDEIDEYAEKYTLVDDGGDVLAKYTYSTNVFPDAVSAEFPFRKMVEELIGMGYHLFNDDVREWENSIEESWFMEHELKELELPKPEHVNLLHIGWMVMDSEDSGFYCACQNPKDFDIVLKSAIPFLCPLCNKKRERWFGGGYDLEDWLIKDGFSLDSEFMKKWIHNLMQHSEKFVKESFKDFLNKTHFNPDRLAYGQSAVPETLSKKDAGNLMKWFEKDIRDG